jgi:hypothetical protein
MMMHAFTVNWLSILLGAIAAWLFGGAYYSGLSKLWMAALGKTQEQCQAEFAAKSTAEKALPFVLVFAADIVMGWALYGILIHVGTFSVRAGLISAVAIWFAFVLTTVTVNNAFQGRKHTLSLIDGGGWLGAMLIIGAIVGGMGK